jgi:thymidylate synthase
MSVFTESIGDCWISCMEHVLRHGNFQMDEDIAIQETLGLSVNILNPKCHDDLVEKIGDKAVILRTLTKFSKGVEMPERPFTYGSRIFDNSGVNQFEWIVDRLKVKRETKSATIGLLIPGSEDANLPCLTTIDAKIRDNRLELQFFFRSQNIFGRQYANLLALSKLQSDIAAECMVEMGSLRGYIDSAHIYAFDIPEAQRIVSGEQIAISDKYYLNGPRSIRVSKITNAK